MSLPGPQPGDTSGPGPILALALESLRMLVRNFGCFARLALLPAFASFLLELLLFGSGVAELADPQNLREPTVGDLGMPLLVLLLNFALVSLFAVAWTRVVLLDPSAEPGLLFRWGARELGYVLRLIPLTVGMVAIALLPALLLADSAIRGILTFVAAIVALFLFVRCMLVLPAAALGLRFGFADAMASTRGNIPFSIVLASFVICLPFIPLFLLVEGLLRATGLAETAPYASLFLQVAIGYAMQAGAIGLQALLFRHLTGWRPNPPRPISV